MGDFIKSLSDVHLPTILVIASLFFLFIGIGGQLGGHVATNDIRRRTSVFLGGILLFSGVVLYIIGQQQSVQHLEVAVQKHQENNLEQKNRYLLRPNSVPEGRTVEASYRFAWNNGKFSMRSKKKNFSGKFYYISNGSDREEVLSTDDGYPSTIKRTIISDVATSAYFMSGKEKTKTEHGVLSGFSMLIERKKNVWVKSLLEAEPTEPQKVKLKPEPVDEFTAYPDKKIAIGESWSFEGLQMARLAGLGSILYLEGGAIMRLKEITDCNNEKCALIKVDRFWVKAKTIQGDGFLEEFEEGVISIGGQGIIYRSLSTYTDLKVEFSGAVNFEGIQVIENTGYNMVLSGIFDISQRASVIYR